MSEIVPTEAELKAAKEIISWLMGANMIMLDPETLAVTIARHTRYEGKTSDEIATLWVKELVCAFAAVEKAERYRLASLNADSRIAELETEIRVLREIRDALEREREKVEEHWHLQLEAATTHIAQLKQDCADAAEAALQRAPDYESMHTMVRAAIMQVGNNGELSGGVGRRSLK
jgi:hypothetical protein